MSYEDDVKELQEALNLLQEQSEDLIKKLKNPPEEGWHESLCTQWQYLAKYFEALRCYWREEWKV